MLNNILNLDGVTLLDKKHQKQVNGGGNCRITVLNNGVRTTISIKELSEDPGEQTAAAHSACGFFLNEGADRCFYDCSYD